MGRQSRRIILYSHDAVGIGHIRRNLLLATAITQSADADVLLISGIVEAGAFDLPPRVDCLTLPSLQKQQNSQYHPRRLAIETKDLIALRAAAIQSAVRAFAPRLTSATVA